MTMDAAIWVLVAIQAARLALSLAGHVEQRRVNAKMFESTRRLEPQAWIDAERKARKADRDPWSQPPGYEEGDAP